MKNFLILLTLCLYSQSIFSQVNPGFRYQTVLRDMSRQVLVNQAVSFRMSLLEDTPNGIPVYTETHQATTNQLGLVSFTIGEGNNPIGDIKELEWSGFDYFLQVEIDQTGGSNFDLMGVSRIVLPPYAIDPLDDEDQDNENELQDLSKNGNEITLSLGGGTITLEDDDPNNELQELAITGTELSIQNGNSISLAEISTKWVDNSNGIHYTSGDVGIGTTNPTAGLQIVKGGGSPGLSVGKVGGNEPVAIFYQDLNPVAEAMRIERNGNVGIGTSNPEATLQVNGTVSLFGSLQTYEVGTEYTAPTDAILIVEIREKGANSAKVSILINNDIEFGLSAYPQENPVQTTSIPIAKGEVWRVDQEWGDPDQVKVYYRTIGL